MEQGSSLLKSDDDRRCALYVLTSAALLALAVDAPAQTLVHRCTTPSGKIEFRQRPCADGAKEQELVIEDRKSGWKPAQTQTKRKVRAKKERKKRKANIETDAARARRKEKCWDKRRRLEDINWQLKRGYKPAKGVKLRHKRRIYEDYISHYCD